MDCPRMRLRSTVGLPLPLMLNHAQQLLLNRLYPPEKHLTGIARVRYGPKRNWTCRNGTERDVFHQVLLVVERSVWRTISYCVSSWLGLQQRRQNYAGLESDLKSDMVISKTWLFDEVKSLSDADTVEANVNTSVILDTANPSTSVPTLDMSEVKLPKVHYITLNAKWKNAAALQTLCKQH